MNHWKRTMGTLCLTGLLCLSLAACGGKAPTASKSAPSSAPDTSEPVAGADWTTWGIINDQKTLIQMGAEKEVYVCTYDDRVDLNETVGGSAPTLYTQLTYPKKVESAAKAYEGISFVDRRCHADPETGGKDDHLGVVLGGQRGLYVSERTQPGTS